MLSMLQFLGYAPVYPIKPLLPGLRYATSKDFQRDGLRIPHCPYLVHVWSKHYPDFLSLEWLELNEKISSLNTIAESKRLFWAPNLPSKAEVKAFLNTQELTGNVTHFKGRNI